MSGHRKYEVDLKSAVWRKSRQSNGEGNCVEVAFVDDIIAVRDSKNRSKEPLIFTKNEWKAFLGGVRQSEFDLS